MTTQNCHSGIKSADIESLDLGLFHSLLDKRLEIEGVLCCDDLFKYGLCLGVLGSEYSAAVLVWLDGYIKCIYLSCYFNYLALVHADNGTEYWHTAGIVGAYDSAHGLACNLTNALSCNEGSYAVFLANSLGNFHHKAAHDDGEQLFGAVVSQSFLYLGKGNAVECGIAAPWGYLLAKALYLHSCSVRGVWGRNVVDSGNVYSTLCHHIACNRAVDTARKQQHSSA